MFPPPPQVKKGFDYSVYWPTDWLKMDSPQISPYYPQVGDIVSYCTCTVLYLFIYLLIYLFVYLFIYLFIHLFSLFIYYLFILSHTLGGVLLSRSYTCNVQR